MSTLGKPGAAASADEVLALLREIVSPLETGRVPLADALGRVLRETVLAPEDQPAFDRSAVDGYAVRVDDPSDSLRLVDAIRAGEWKPRRIVPGEAVRIATGGALPDDGLRVIMREDVRVEGDRVIVLRREEGRNVRFRGEDARCGERMLEAETRLGPGQLGLLASLGVAACLVTRRLRVWHLATGSEIVPPEETPGPGQIRDSNSTLVRGFLAGWPVDLDQQRAPEEEAAVAALLAGAVSRPDGPDVLLVSGGASVGEHDFTRRLLEREGFNICVSKTTARPGKPLVVARRGRMLAFGLPGNPLAHFVCLNLYVRVALEALAGSRIEAPWPFQVGRLGAALAADPHDRETFWPARWSGEDGVARVTPLRWRSSGDLTPLAAANALIRVAPGTGALACDTRVEFVPTGGLS